MIGRVPDATSVITAEAKNMTGSPSSEGYMTVRTDPP
jgi:hypothetical protein